MEWKLSHSVLAGLLGLLFAILYRYVQNVRRNYYWRGKSLPYVEPAIFAALLKGKQGWVLEQELVHKHGRIFGVHQVFESTIFVTEPELIRKIMVKDFHHFADRRFLHSSSVVEKSFMTFLRGEDWKRVRNLTTPTFSTGKLKKMEPVMNVCASNTTQYLMNIAKDEGTVDCKKTFGAFVLDLIASTAFGTQLDSAQDPDNIFVKNVDKINKNSLWRVIILLIFPRLAKLFKLSLFEAGTLKFFSELTETVIKKRIEMEESRADFLQSMLEAQTRWEQQDNQEIEEDNRDVLSDEARNFMQTYNRNKGISRQEMVSQSVLFFTAGYDTTASVMSWTAYYLALNPRCQEKVIDEVDRVWKDHPVPDSEALGKLKYLEAAILESLRLSPPATRLEREATCDYPLEGTGDVIPKGMIVVFPIYAIQRDPEFFPDPETYDPNRFMPENKDSIRPYTFMPFGSGPRNCIGMRFAMMEMKLCFMHIFRKISFQPCAKTKVPMEITGSSILLQPKEVILKAVPRTTVPI